MSEDVEAPAAADVVPPPEADPTPAPPAKPKAAKAAPAKPKAAPVAKAEDAVLLVSQADTAPDGWEITVRKQNGLEYSFRTNAANAAIWRQRGKALRIRRA